MKKHHPTTSDQGMPLYEEVEDVVTFHSKPDEKECASYATEDQLLGFGEEGLITDGEIRVLRQLKRNLEGLLAKTPECNACQIRLKIIGLLKSVQMYDRPLPLDRQL